MGLLKSVKDVPNIDFYEYREIDYWNKYKFRARFFLKGARLLYFVKNVFEFVKKVNDGGWKYNRLSEAAQKDVITNIHVYEKLIALRNILAKSKEGTVRIENETVAVFSNDLPTLLQIKSWSSNIKCDITEVQTGTYSGVKYFVREPKSKYRVYLRSKRVNENVLTDLEEFFERNKQLKPSKSLQVWVSTATNKKYSYRSRFCSAAYSIDYDDESTLSLLALMHGDLIGRRYKLEKRQ